MQNDRNLVLLTFEFYYKCKVIELPYEIDLCVSNILAYNKKITY